VVFTDAARTKPKDDDSRNIRRALDQCPGRINTVNKFKRSSEAGFTGSWKAARSPAAP
jgi:hypothetical protein